MDKGKKIEVGASTLVDLKAEIFRKQEELKRQKVKQQNVQKLKLGKKFKPRLDSLGKSNPGVGTRGAKDQEYRVLDEGEHDVLAASRKKLEEKSILYERMMSGKTIPDDDCCMVDFQRKTLDLKHNYIKENTCKIGHIQEFNLESDDEWTDYTDSLGRSRRCLKADLPRMIAMDLDLQQRIPEHPSSKRENEEELQVVHTEEVFSIPETPIGPMHYQNIEHNEIRSHGVGYFGFSQSEDERKQQMEMLNKLRDQTKTQKARLDKVKEKRQAALKARLKKVKQRKLLKEGNTLPDSESSSDELESLAETSIQETVASVKEEEATEDQKEKLSTVRPWDRGKIGPRVIQPFRQASQKEWVDKQREERVSEFAPPSSYYQNNPVEEMHQFFRQQNTTFGFQDIQHQMRTPPPPLQNAPAQSSQHVNIVKFAALQIRRTTHLGEATCTACLSILFLKVIANGKSHLILPRVWYTGQCRGLVYYAD